MIYFAPTPNLLKIKSASFNLNAVAGNYTLFTASGGDVWVEVSAAYVKSAAAGLTSALIETNHTVAKPIVASALLAAITLDLSMTIVTASFILPASKIIRGTIVGTGSGGEIILVVKYYPLSASADLI